MLSAIIATHESERALVPTLAALVPGAIDGLVTEVIVADGGSRDATKEVADMAGCRFLVLGAPVGERLKQAAASARAPWLLFLRAGTVPEPAWIAAADRFIEDAPNRSQSRAAVFSERASGERRGAFREIVGLLRGLTARPDAGQGLLIARAHYDALGGHRTGAAAEADLLRRIGRRHIGVLAATASRPQ